MLRRWSELTERKSQARTRRPNWWRCAGLGCRGNVSVFRLRSANPFRSAVLAFTAVSLVAAQPAVASGVPAQVAAGGGALWTCSNAGLTELDARTGRVLSQPRVGASFPLQVALGSGAAWVAGVENGFTAGALTRIDLASGRQATRLRLRTGPVFAVAAGGGAVWALVGSTSHAQVARVNPRSGRKFGVVRGATQPSSLAADASGVWIADASGWLLHARPGAGRAVRVLSVPSRSVAPPAVALGLGSAWASDGKSLVRIDEVTNKEVARIRLPAVPTAVAVGQGVVWAILYRPPEQYTLVRVNASTNRVTARTRIPTASSSVAVGAGGVWLGLSGTSSGAAPRVLRVDPRTLELRLLARLL